MQNWQEYAVRQYFEEKRSTHSIGRELGKNPKAIRDVILKSGRQLRSKGEAQSLHIQRNGPPINRPRTKEEKEKISESLRLHWDSLEDGEKEAKKTQMSERAKLQWQGVGDDEKEALLAPMQAAARQQIGMGSKVENKIGELLSKQGFIVRQRTTALIHPKHVDILLPKERIVVECDGPSHFSNIYGEDELRIRQRRDDAKNTLIIGLAHHIIRVQDHSTAYSLAVCNRAANEIITIIERIRCEKIPPRLWTILLN